MSLVTEHITATRTPGVERVEAGGTILGYLVTDHGVLHAVPMRSWAAHDCEHALALVQSPEYAGQFHAPARCLALTDLAWAWPAE